MEISNLRNCGSSPPPQTKWMPHHENSSSEGRTLGVSSSFFTPATVNRFKRYLVVGAKRNAKRHFRQSERSDREWCQDSRERDRLAPDSRKIQDSHSFTHNSSSILNTCCIAEMKAEVNMSLLHIAKKLNFNFNHFF
jgi:hypothetical protein